MPPPAPPPPPRPSSSGICVLVFFTQVVFLYQLRVFLSQVLSALVGRGPIQSPLLTYFYFYLSHESLCPVGTTLFNLFLKEFPLGAVTIELSKEFHGSTTRFVKNCFLTSVFALTLCNLKWWPLNSLNGLQKSRKENPQKLAQLSSRSHPRHLVGKRTAQKDTIIVITSDSHLNSNFKYRWSPASLTFNNYFYLFLYLYITWITINFNASHLKSPKKSKQKSRRILLDHNDIHGVRFCMFQQDPHILFFLPTFCSWRSWTQG